MVNETDFVRNRFLEDLTSNCECFKYEIQCKFDQILHFKQNSAIKL